MDSSGFLRSVSFGGFDKKDVLAYVDDLNTKIYTLESELEDAKKNVGNGKGGTFAGKEELEKSLAKERAKSSELMGKVDTLTLTVQSNESVISDKDKEIQSLKEKIEELESASPAEPAEATSYDIGNVFIEAKKSADKIVAEARTAAKKMDADAKELAEQVVGEANSKAQDIVSDAESQAHSIIDNAQGKTEKLNKISAETEAKVKETVDALYQNISKINETIQEFTSVSSSNVDKARSILDDTKAMISNVDSVPKSSKPANNNYNNNKPAPKKEPAINSDLADLVKQVEAVEM